jgi:Protein of unknown function (DUF2778)
MTFGFGRRISCCAHDALPLHRQLPSNELPRTIAGSVATALIVVLGVWALFDLCHPGDQIDRGGDKSDRAATLGDRFNAAVTRGDKLHVAKLHLPAANLYASLFDSRFSLGGAPESFVNSTPPQDDGDAAPAPLAPALQLAGRDTRAASAMPSRGDQATAKRIASSAARPAAARDGAQQQQANTAVDTRTFFEKLFGKPAPVTLAYAATDDAGLGTSKNIAGRYDRWTAVYDISAHTVYMPDGSQLEAHSGLGNLLDDPQHPDEKMRGVTPPNIYNLELREAPFHGVRALRMIPQDERKTFGRSGLLAHTFMLGPKGDSNGCVSFRNYDAFLQAYLKQDIKRLAVVTRFE